MTTSASPLLSPEEFSSLKHRDERAFKKVYDAYFAIVFYVVGRCGLVKNENESAVQETFFHLLKSAAEIKDVEDIRAWLVATARSMVVDRHRRRRELEEGRFDIDDLNDDGPSIEEAQAKYRREIDLKIIGEHAADKNLGSTGGLLSDGEFVLLMFKDFESSNSNIDLLAKKRIWAGLIDQINEDKTQTKSKSKNWRLVVLLIAGLLAVVVGRLLYYRYAPITTDEVIEEHEKGIPLTLIPFVYKSDREVSPYNSESRQLDDDVAFKVRLSRSGYVALAKIDGNASVEVVASSQPMESGSDFFMQINGASYTYKIKAEDEEGRTRFCAIAYDSLESLEEALDLMREDKSFSIDGTCISL